MTSEYFLESLWWHRPHTSSKEFNLDQKGLAFALGSWEVIFTSRNILPDRSVFVYQGAFATRDGQTLRLWVGALGQLDLWYRGPTDWSQLLGQLTVSTWESPKKTLDTKVQVSFCSWETHTDPGRSKHHPQLHQERTTGKSAFGILLDFDPLPPLLWLSLNRHPFPAVNHNHEYNCFQWVLWVLLLNCYTWRWSWPCN